MDLGSLKLLAADWWVLAHQIPVLDTLDLAGVSSMGTACVCPSWDPGSFLASH